MQYMNALHSLTIKTKGIAIVSVLLLVATVSAVSSLASHRMEDASGKAWAYYQKGEYGQCQKFIESSDSAEFASLKNIRALCLMHTNKVDEAIVVLKTIASSRNCLYMANLSYAYALNGQDVEASKIANELRTHYEASTVARVNFVRGLLAERGGNLDIALDEFSTSVHIDPNQFPDTLVEMAALEQKVNDPAGARWAKDRLQRIQSHADSVLGQAHQIKPVH